MALFPRAVPGIVAGMGFLYAMILIPPMGWIRNSVWLMIVAYIMRYIPLAYGALAPSSLQISRDLDRSANIIGANWWQATRTIVLPLMAPAMFSSYVLLFIYFFKEYSVAVFLFSPGNEVIGSVLLNAWGLGDFGVVSALATLQILITLAFVVGARRLFGVGFHA
jgi:iron(III) transport system permease protein